MTLGLRRGEVDLVPHQRIWGDVFANEKNVLLDKFGSTAIAVEHVGSTAVPDLLAKPIIDIAVGVSSLGETASWPEQLLIEGYTFFGDREERGEHFYAKGPEQLRTVYLHVVPIEHQRWANYLKFRDTLRSDSRLRQEYENLKRRLAATNPNNRLAYSNAKDAFIHSILIPEQPLVDGLSPGSKITGGLP